MKREHLRGSTERILSVLLVLIKFARLDKPFL